MSKDVLPAVLRGQDSLEDHHLATRIAQARSLYLILSRNCYAQHVEIG